MALGNDRASSSSALADLLPVLLLLARWLRLRALQLQRACDFARNDLDVLRNFTDTASSRPSPASAQDLEQMFAAGFESSGRDMQAAVEFVGTAASNAAGHLGCIQGLARCCCGEHSEAAGAMQQLRSRSLDMWGEASTVCSTLSYALLLPDALLAQGRTLAPSPGPTFGDSSSSDAEHERCRAQFAAATSCEQLWHVLCSYGALQQLPQDALQLSEQLLAGLPVGWCCNNPGCSNSDGPSERALVARRGCVCSGCRTARWVANCVV